MLRPDQKAAAQVAWQNFERKDPAAALRMNMDEDKFLGIMEQLEKSYRHGRITPKVYDQRLTTLLRNPGMALEVETYVPPKLSTQQIYKELKAMHARGGLTDDEFAERKEELAFERADFIDPDSPDLPDGQVNSEKEKYRAYLSELLSAGVLNDDAHREAIIRLDNLYAQQQV